jgi:uncharacterized protein YndB with AHSA1/START domain
VAYAYASVVIPAPAEEVWALIRDFNALPRWWRGGPTSSEIEDGKAGDQVSAVRKVGDEGIREVLLSHSDLERTYSYAIPEPPFPVKNYVGTMQVIRVTDDDASLVQWSATFDAALDDLEHWQDHLSNVVFQGGLAGLKSNWTAGTSDDP